MRKQCILFTLIMSMCALTFAPIGFAENLTDAEGRHYVDLGVPDGAPLGYELLSTQINDEFELGTPTYYTGDPVQETAHLVVGQGPDSEDDRTISLLGSQNSNVATVVYRQINSDYHIQEGMDAVYFRQKFRYKNNDQFRWVAGLRGTAANGEGAQLLAEINGNKQLKLGAFVSEKTVPEDEWVTMELFVNFTDKMVRAYINQEEYTNGPESFEVAGDNYPTKLEMIMAFSMSSGGAQFELDIDDMIVSDMAYGAYELLDAEGAQTANLAFPEAKVKFHIPKAVLAGDSSFVDLESFQIDKGAVIDSVEWEDDGMSCTVSLSNLAEGQKYQISFAEDGADPFQVELETKRSLTPENIRFYNESGTDITDSGLTPGKVEAQLSIVNETENDLPVFVVAALYENGYMTDMQYIKTETLGGQTTPVSIETDVPNDGKEYELKLYYLSDPLHATAFYQASSFTMAGTEVPNT